MGETLDCFSKGIEFTQSHRPEEAIPDSYDKCEPGFNLKLDEILLMYLPLFRWSVFKESVQEWRQMSCRA